mmetsp:Transcript_133095/g.413838  ORF Transcript_133095/g.413838 Transcript_133095/m.413838 type:complete len:200 (-) Transcript_133095:148-747(-)
MPHGRQEGNLVQHLIFPLLGSPCVRVFRGWEAELCDDINTVPGRFVDRALQRPTELLAELHLRAVDLPLLPDGLLLQADLLQLCPVTFEQSLDLIPPGLLRETQRGEAPTVRQVHLRFVVKQAADHGLAPTPRSDVHRSPLLVVTGIGIHVGLQKRLDLLDRVLCSGVEEIRRCSTPLTLALCQHGGLHGPGMLCQLGG